LSDRRSLTDWEADGFTPEAHLPVRVSLLRWKLGRKAKQEPGFRFYNLFGHVLRADVLAAASQRVRTNRGGPGVDGVTWATIDAQPGGEVGWLETLAEEASRRGDRAAAAGWWRQLSRADPLHLPAAVNYLEALDAIGDRTGARRFAQAYEARLRADPVERVLASAAVGEIA
jgi:hypothetical protein